jgi:Rrf2 family protein
MQLQLTYRGAYAIRAILHLARADGALVTSASIADAMAIPPQFLPQVMTDLVRARIVEGRVGRAGGYRLEPARRAVSLLEVIDAVEGDPRWTRCVLRDMACSPATACDVHAAFAAVQDAMLSTLSVVSIRDVVAGDGPTTIVSNGTVAADVDGRP